MPLGALVLALASPALADIGVPLGVRGYHVGQVGANEALAASTVISSCFFDGAREGPHRVELINNALRARMGPRLKYGGIQRDDRGSLVIGVTPVEHQPTDLVAVAELSIQPRNGRVPGNFRPKAFPAGETFVPYICNLAVQQEHRQRGIARALMQVCEVIASEVWGDGELYLHVDGRNSAALGLYKSLGYEALPHWDVPHWKEETLGLVPNRYHRKVISTDPSYAPHDDGVDLSTWQQPTLGFAIGAAASA